MNPIQTLFNKIITPFAPCEELNTIVFGTVALKVKATYAHGMGYGSRMFDPTISGPFPDSLTKKHTQSVCKLIIISILDGYDGGEVPHHISAAVKAFGLGK